MLHKKSALQLSINAIVILILAITMLGLGLGFMRNIFGSATEQFEAVTGAVEKQMLEQMKASGKIVDLSRPKITMEKGKTEQIYIGFKNTGSEPEIFTIKGVKANSLSGHADNCGLDKDTHNVVIEYKCGATTVQPGDTVVLPINVKTQSKTKKDSCFYEILIDEIGESGGANFVPSHTWNIDKGSVGTFNQNGATSENVRECGTGPYGGRVILWKAGNDASSNADGGWNTNTFPIDKTKKYRSSVWIRKTNSNAGTTYFGVYVPVQRLTGHNQGNPYFFCGDLPSLNKWYLVVGYIHEKGTTVTTSEGGIWDGETGLKVRTWGTTQCNGDYKFSPSSSRQRQRAYLYYDTNTADRQYFWDPRFEEVNGEEPTIEQLLQGYGKSIQLTVDVE